MSRTHHHGRPDQPGRVRGERDRDRGTVDYYAECGARGCQWRSDRFRAVDHDSVQLSSPATVPPARALNAHLRAKHPDLFEEQSRP